MANKQVRLTDQEHQLILLIRAGALDMDTINGLLVDSIIRKVTLEQQLEPIPQLEPEPEQQPEPEPIPQPEPILRQLIKHYNR